MAAASMKSYEKSFSQQKYFSSTDEDTPNYQRNHKPPLTFEKTTKYVYNTHNKTEDNYTPKQLDLSLSDLNNLSNLVQRIRKHRINPHNGSTFPQFVIITNKRNDFSINKMESFQSYLELQHYLPITFDLSGDNQQNQHSMDGLIRSLIEVYPKALILFRLKESENPFAGLYFTANVEVSSKIAEFLKGEGNLSETEANLSVWKVAQTKDLVSWNSHKDEFTKSGIYYSYNENEHQSKSLNNVFEYIETQDSKGFSGNSEYEYSGHSRNTHSSYSSSAHERSTHDYHKWSYNTVKSFNAKFDITACTNEDKVLEIIHVIKITVQVSAEDREMIIKCLKYNVLESDAYDICYESRSDDSLSIHPIITEHLKIESVDKAIEGLTFFVGGFDELKNLPPLVWETAFVMKYLEKVLEGQEDEWRETYNKADKWISEFRQDMDQYKGLLYAASEEYLIQQGIIVYNDLSQKITVSFEVDDKTNESIRGMLGSTADDDEGFADIIGSQISNGSFKRRELISGISEISETCGSFKVKLEPKNIGRLKNYAEKLCLRRLDNSVWITSLIIVYFEIVLDKYRSKPESESEWSSAYENAKAFVQQSVRNSKYEEELHDACEKYLLGLGYNYLTKNYLTKKYPLIKYPNIRVKEY